MIVLSCQASNNRVDKFFTKLCRELSLPIPLSSIASIVNCSCFIPVSLMLNPNTHYYLFQEQYNLHLPRKVWRYQRDNQKKNGQYNGQKKKVKQLSAKHCTENKWSNNVNPTKNRSWTWCLEGVSRSCSTCSTRGDILVTNPVVSHE